MTPPTGSYTGHATPIEAREHVRVRRPDVHGTDIFSSTHGLEPATAEELPASMQRAKGDAASAALGRIEKGVGEIRQALAT